MLDPVSIGLRYAIADGREMGIRFAMKTNAIRCIICMGIPLRQATLYVAGMFAIKVGGNSRD